MPSIVTLILSSFTIERGLITAFDSISKKPYTDYLSKALLLPKPRYEEEKYM